MADEQEYKAGKKLYFTYSQDDQVRQEVTDNGILEIINQDDIVIASFPLENIQETNMMNSPNKIAKEEIKNVKKSEPLMIHITKLVIFGLYNVFINIYIILLSMKTYFFI